MGSESNNGHAQAADQKKPRIITTWRLIYSPHPAPKTRAVVGTHAVMILDHAGSRVDRDVNLPNNMLLLFLLPNVPELRAIENRVQFLKYD